MNWLLRWMRPEGIRWERWEPAVLRVLFAVVLYINLPSEPAAWTAQPYVHGFARWWDFTFAAQPQWFWPTRHVSLGAIICYAAGAGILLPLGWLLFFQTCISTLNLSQGMPGHSGQIVMLTALGMWIMAAWRWGRARFHWQEGLWPSWETQAASLDGARQAIAATYVVAGVTKLINSEGAWLERSGNFVLQWKKAVEEIYYTDGMPKEGLSADFGELLLAHPWVAVIFLGSGLALEFAAVLALLNRRVSLVIGLLLLAFHLSLETLMNLPFNANQRLVMIFLVLPLWWLGVGWKRVVRRPT